MGFITILIALAVEQYYPKIEAYRHFDWFSRYCDWLQQNASGLIGMFPSVPGTVRLLVILVPVLALVALFNNILSDAGSFFSFLFGLAVLIYSIGPRDINAQTDKYLSAVAAEDDEAALLYANEFFSGHHYEPAISGNPALVASLMKRGILLAFSNRILAVLFWFILLGPLGALLYRLTTLLLERFAGSYFGSAAEDESLEDADSNDFSLAIKRLYMILGWVPARLCVVTFALAGSFSDTLLCWHCATDFFNKNNDELIVNSGLHALKMDVEADEQAEVEAAEVEQVLALVKWSTIIVITTIALMTIVGWF